MKMKDLEKLAKKADEIFRERERKTDLLLKAGNAGLIKKPLFKREIWFWRVPSAHYCPECNHKLTVNLEERGFHYRCINCDYEYVY